MMDTVGNKVALGNRHDQGGRPSMACQVIDWAMQVHGGAGVSDDLAGRRLRPAAHAALCRRPRRGAPQPDRQRELVCYAALDKR